MQQSGVPSCHSLLPAGSCRCVPAACARLAYVIFTLPQETLHISEPYELLEGTKPLSPLPGAAASLASPPAHSYPKAQEVMAPAARACVLAPSAPCPAARAAARVPLLAPEPLQRPTAPWGSSQALRERAVVARSGCPHSGRLVAGLSKTHCVDTFGSGSVRKWLLSSLTEDNLTVNFCQCLSLEGKAVARLLHV